VLKKNGARSVEIEEQRQRWPARNDVCYIIRETPLAHHHNK
jgi:hypothetical protein